MDLPFYKRFLPIATVATALACFCGRLGMPGLLGHAREYIVEWAKTATDVTAYVAAVLLLIALGHAAYSLSTTYEGPRLLAIQRGLVVAAGGVALAMIVPAFFHSIPQVLSLGLAFVCAFAALMAASVALRTKMTRAAGLVLLLYGLCILLRLGSWECNYLWSHRNEDALRDGSVHLQQAALVLEAMAQVVVATWAATRAPYRGRLLVHSSLAAALVLTYFVMRVDEASSGVLTILRAGLDRTASLPHEFLTPLEMFLTPASVFVGFTVALQDRKYAPMHTGMALLVLSRAQPDMPLAGLMIMASAGWTLAAATARAAAETRMLRGEASASASAQ